MPLPASAVERKLLHTRTITCQGYERADGLWDVDGWLTDIKTYSFANHDRGEVKAGEPLHGMGIRLTYDKDFTIVDIVAVTDFSPFHICAHITPNFKKLIGLRMVAGFTKKSRTLMAGVEGCTHLVDLLGPIATTAFQTVAGKKLQDQKPSATSPRPFLLNSCYGWAEDGEMVKRLFPDHFTGEKV